MKVYKPGVEVIEHFEAILRVKGDLKAYAERLAREALAQRYNEQAQGIVVRYSEHAHEFDIIANPLVTREQEINNILTDTIPKIKEATDQITFVKQWLPLISGNDLVEFSVEELKQAGYIEQ